MSINPLNPNSTPRDWFRQNVGWDTRATLKNMFGQADAQPQMFDNSYQPTQADLGITPPAPQGAQNGPFVSDLINTDNSTNTGGDTGGASSGNLQDYLNLINSQRGILQNQYSQGFTNANTQSGRQGLNLQANASQGISDINSNMADANKQGAESGGLIRAGADTARYNAKTGITNNFSARGAIDSSYYNRALEAGLGDINQQEKTQLTSITQALDKAASAATKQKNQIQMQLTSALQDLEDKRVQSLGDLQTQYDQGMISLAQLENEANQPITKYASTDEINSIQALSKTNFNIDNYISQIDAQANDAIGQIKTSAGQTQQAGVDMSNVQNLLGSLSKGLSAGYRKSDFVPLLVSKGYTPEQAQNILSQAELFGKNAQQPTTAQVSQQA